MKHFYYLLFILYLPCNLLAQQPADSTQTALQFHASYIGDVVNNFNGGIKKGTTYLGLVNAKLDFSTERAHWWRGGELFINLANTHGGQPSANLVGDFQGVSNIEAGNLTFLYELWYKQRIANVSFTVGLQDLNANFASSANGALFTNSSFGIQSSIADNIPTPIFPLTALGALLQWKLSPDYQLQAALFDGTPDDFESNPFNVHWKLNKAQGLLAVTEFQVNKSLMKGLAGTYKVGIYLHEHNDSTNVEQENRGFYLIADQGLSSHLSVFTQIGFSPKALNLHNHFYSLGFNYKGFFKQRVDDEMGLAVAYAGIDGNNIGSETAIELTYLLKLNKHFYLRPDLQYIINPAGTNIKLKNAFVGSARFGIHF